MTRLVKQLLIVELKGEAKSVVSSTGQVVCVHTSSNDGTSVDGQSVGIRGCQSSLSVELSLDGGDRVNFV